MTYTKILACGAFGGMCPSVARIASELTASTDPAMPNIGVLVAMGLFAFLGAGIALGFGAREVKAAIIAGIAAPGIVTNVVAGAHERAEVVTDDVALSLFASPAYAQGIVGEAILVDTSGRVLTLIPTVTGGEIGESGLDITFETASGMTLPGTTLYNGKNPGLRVSVPDDATTLVIGSSKHALPQNADEARVMIETSPTFGGDLLWALGGDRNYAVGAITVTYGQ